jgi:hypothetical protein
MHSITAWIDFVVHPVERIDLSNAVLNPIARYRLVQCKIPLRFEGESILPSKPTPAACPSQ